MSKAIFFLRHNNDIDHISPILYKWITTKNISTDIIITSEKSLLEDYRIKYLQQISKDRQDVHFYHFSNFLSPFQKYVYKLYKIYIKHPDLMSFSRVEEIMDKVIQKILPVDGGVICFDWNSDYFTNHVCNIAKMSGITTVALPHGDEPYWNIIQREQDIHYSDAIKIYENQKFFDYIVVPNKLCSRRYKFMEEQIKILGSPRYCDEWLSIHNTIKPKESLDFLSHNHQMRIVLFLRNCHFPINWEEVVIAIKLITQFPEVFLIVKNHPRGKKTYDIYARHPELGNKKNLYIDNSINSSSLISWADLVLDIGTSVTWESIKIGKPTLMLEYLQSNESTASHYLSSIIVRSRDELLDNLRKFSKNKQRKIFRENQSQKFISEIIDYPDKQVLERYVKFLEECVNND